MSLILIIIVLLILFGAGGYVGRGPIYGSPVYAGGYGIPSQRHLEARPKAAWC